MVDFDAALFHHFFKLPIADRIRHIPTDTPRITSRSRWSPLNSIILLFRWNRSAIMSQSTAKKSLRQNPS